MTNTKINKFCAFHQAWFLVETFSLKYFLKSRAFTENLFVYFYICHLHFLSFFFSPLVTVGGQNLGLRVEKREGGVRDAEKRAGRKS